MLRNRPRCNIKAQQEKLLLKRQLWDWLECGVIDRRRVCFKRGTRRRSPHDSLLKYGRENALKCAAPYSHILAPL